MLRRLLFSSVVALAAVVVNWLVFGSSSPLHDYFLRHGSAIEDFWAALNIGPVILAALISHNHGGGDEAVYLLLVFVQWFIFALVVSHFLFKLAARARKV
jgi:hypothetical protein